MFARSLNFQHVATRETLTLILIIGAFNFKYSTSQKFGPTHVSMNDCHIMLKMLNSTSLMAAGHQPLRRLLVQFLPACRSVLG